MVAQSAPELAVQVAYTPENIIDAHLVKGLLASVGIHSHIRGEHLVGAMGELPAIGLLAVMVADEDLASARAVVLDWETADLDDKSAPGDDFIVA